MNNRKYELLQDQTIEWCGRTLYRIRALRDFGAVHAGDVGGYIECERNLSQDGNAWVCGDAWVRGDARVCGNALVCGNARVRGNALVCGDTDG